MSGAGRSVLSIRARLLFLGVTTVLIVVGLLSTLVLRDFRSEHASATQRLLNVAEALAVNVGNEVAASRSVVQRFSRDAAPVLGDPSRCGAWMGRATDALPPFSNVALVPGSGIPVCSLLPDIVGVEDYSDRDWLRRALEGEGGVFTPRIGNGPSAWAAVLTEPVTDALGEPLGAVALFLELARLQDLLGSVSLPERAMVTVATEDGIIVARTQDPQTWVGRRLPPETVAEEPLGPRGTLTEATSLEGDLTLFAKVPVPGVSWTVYAGWSKAEALGPARRAAWRSGGLAALALALTALGVSWVYFPTTRSLRRLVQETGDAFLRRGPLTRGGPAEVRSVAERFNETLQALAQAEDEARKLARALSQLADPVFITDPSGVIEYVNPAFERVTGYSAEEATGRTPSILKSGAHAPEVYSELWRTIRAGHTYRGRFQNRRKNGEIYTEEKTIAPLRNEKGQITHFISAGKDVSDKEALTARLSHAEKLEAVGQIAAGVAHDFNNLLTAISGYAELIAADLDPVTDTEALGHVQKILAGTQMGGSLTEQLVSLGRRKLARAEPVSLNSVIERLTAFLRRVIPGNITVTLDLDPEAGHAWLDPIRAEQLLLNLALNARDAMPDGGVLTLRTGTAPASEGAPLGWLTLEVSDTGVGIAPGLMDRMFEPFFTTKGHGTGLGLATVAEVVRGAGGEVDVASRPNEGTTFSLRFPSYQAPADRPRPRRAGPGPEPERLPGRTVLLVEDDRQVRSLLSRILRREGHDVRAAASGPAALELADALDGGVHLVITDVMMPDMNGPELVAALRERLPELPAILITGYTEVSLEPGFSTGPTEVLLKPISPPLLRSAVSRMAIRNDQEARDR
jgi:PAS domain S-box-containing protein